MRYGLYHLSSLLSDEGLQPSIEDALLAFDCGHGADDVNRYLRERAVEDDATGRCRTYIIVDQDALLGRTPHVCIVAYFTIAPISLEIDDLLVDDSMREVGEYLLGNNDDGSTRGQNAYGYLISQFAKDTSLHVDARGFLQFAISLIERASQLTGGMYTILDCNCSKLRDYYEGFGFTCIEESHDKEGVPTYKMLRLIGQGVNAGFLSDGLPL